MRVASVIIWLLWISPPASGYVCWSVPVGESVTSVESCGDAAVLVTSSNRVLVAELDASSVRLSEVLNFHLPSGTKVVSVMRSGLGLVFDAGRILDDGIEVYRGVLTHGDRGWRGELVRTVAKFEEISQRVKSGEWRVLEVSNLASDRTGGLYAAALLESVDGDLIVEVWNLPERSVIADFSATEVRRLAIGDEGTLLVACGDGVAVVDGRNVRFVTVPGVVIDMVGRWVLYEDWLGYALGEVTTSGLRELVRLPGPAHRVTVWSTGGDAYILAYGGNIVYVVDPEDRTVVTVLDLPGRVEFLAPPFVVYSGKIGVLYLAKIMVQLEEGLCPAVKTWFVWLDWCAVYIVDRKVPAIYKVVEVRDKLGPNWIKTRSGGVTFWYKRVFLKRVWPRHPTELHLDDIGIVVIGERNSKIRVYCLDERTEEVLKNLLRSPDVCDILNVYPGSAVFIVDFKWRDQRIPAFRFVRKSGWLVTGFIDEDDVCPNSDYDDVVLSVPISPLTAAHSGMPVIPLLYGKDWVLLSALLPNFDWCWDKTSELKVFVNGKESEFYVVDWSNKTIRGPFTKLKLKIGKDKQLFILLRGLSEPESIRIVLKRPLGPVYEGYTEYAPPKVSISRPSARLVEYNAKEDKVTVAVSAEVSVRNTVIRRLTIEVFDLFGRTLTRKVMGPLPPGKHHIEKRLSFMPPEHGPLKIILLAEYDGDLVIVSDREFVLRAEPERAELTVSYERPGRLTARVLDYGRDWVELRVESEEPGNLHLEDSKGRPVPYYVLEGNELSGPYDGEHPLELGTTPVILILRDLKPGEAYRFKLIREGRIPTAFELECALPEANLDVELLSGTLEGRSLTLKFSVRGSTVNSTFKRLNLVLREDDRILWREEVDLDNTTWFDLPFETTVEVGGDEGTLTLEVTAHYDHDTVLPEGNEFEVREAPARRVLRIAYGRPHVELEDYGLNWLLLRILPWRPGDLLVRVNGKPVTYYVKHGNEFEKHSEDDPYHASGANAVEVLLYDLEKHGTITVINRSSTLSSASTLDYALPEGVELAAEVVGGRYLVDEGRLTLNVRTLVSPIDVTVRRIIARVLDDLGEILGETVKTVELGPGIHELTLPIEVRVHRECGRLRLQALAEFDHGTIVRDPGEGPVPNPASRTIEFSYSAPSVRVVDRGIDWVLLEVTTREGGELVVHVNGRKAWYYLKRSRGGDWEGPYDPTSVGPNRTVLVLVPGVPPEGRISVVLGGRLERVRSVEYALPSVIARVDVEDVSVSGEKVIAMISLWLEVLGTTVRSIGVSVDGVKSWSVSALEDGEPLRLDDLELGEGVHLVRLSIKFVPKERAGTVPVTLRVQYEGDSTFDPGRREFVESPLVLTLNVPYVLPQRQTSKESGPRGGSPKVPERGGTAVDRGSTTAGESGTGRSAVTEPTHASTRVERRPSNEERPHVVRPTPPTRFPIRPVRTETGHEVKPKPLEKLPEALPHPSSSLPDTLEARLTPVLVSLFDRLWDLLTSLLSQPTITGHAEGEPTAKVTRRPIEHAPSEPSRPRTPTGSAALQGPPHGTTVPQGYHRVGALSAHAPHTFREVEILKTRTRGYAYAEGTSRVSRSLTRLPPTGVNLLALLLSVFGALTGLYLTHRSVRGGEGGE
ncbi:YncE family protein [Methanopyrus kandleri]|uniref:Uncharacterized secreted protein specific for M.kandleri with repeats, MK-5 family n=2 Tax=Methanopyrus kandleri TaxID=2320 RepID=Q8TW88_METKA|nr:hypothetical protein [Methanopyrus kandleri]AAM02361.1 Uncharacterized secreted protein specific for M.kandleri with repeats, MK-5 family [Methanopyrus kandleri AV19]HII69786.1 hypothetical protein [Methanopyrus kandleri]